MVTPLSRVHLSQHSLQATVRLVSPLPYIATNQSLVRILHLRRTRQPISSIFSYRRNTPSITPSHARPRLYPRTTGLPIPHVGSTPMLPPPIFRVPYTRSSVPHQSQLYPPPNRRTSALDTDTRGRRLGGVTEPDHDGVLEDKDALPMYDVAGGPPKYFELDVFGSRRTEAGSAGVGAFGRMGTSPSSLAYPNAPPGGPDPTSVDNPLVHPTPPPVHDSRAEMGSGSNVPPTTTRRHASLPPLPS
jgi:hypothetical protein